MNQLVKESIESEAKTLASHIGRYSRLLHTLIQDVKLQASERAELGASLLKLILEELRPHLPGLLGVPSDSVITYATEELVNARAICVGVRGGSTPRSAFHLTNHSKELWLVVATKNDRLVPCLVEFAQRGLRSELTVEEAIASGWWVTVIIESLAKALEERLFLALHNESNLQEIKEKLRLTTLHLWTKKG